jgi:hypothetical protein
VKKIYISGPITSITPEMAKPIFEAAENKLTEMGFKAVNPMCNGISPLAPWKEHMRADIKLLMECDGIMMLDNWHKSKGASLEYKNAKGLNFEFMGKHQGFINNLMFVKGGLIITFITFKAWLISIFYTKQTELLTY